MAHKKILMVCLGNICRSPLAEGILRHKALEKGLDWSVDSCGTSGWHEGEMPDSRSVEVARRNGIDISSQRSRKFVKTDFDEFDVILVMDASNYQNVCALSPSDAHLDKVKMILNYVHPGENRKVPDPYYEGGFDYVYELLDEALDRCIDIEKE